jgi:hypothetical protein
MQNEKNIIKDLFYGITIKLGAIILLDLDGLWNWTACKEMINSLPGRLGFQKGEHLEFMRLKLNLRNGALHDLLSNNFIMDNDIKSKHLLRSVFYLLYGYSKVEKINLKGELITSKQIRGKRFINRDIGAKKRLVKEFSRKPKRLVFSAERLGGIEIEFPYGDVAISLKAFPLIPLTIVLYGIDDEFQGDARIFYDASIKDVFDAEQTNFLTHLSISRLIISNHKYT